MTTDAAPAPGALIDDAYQLRSADGTALHVRELRPREGVRARVAVIHGFAEHGGRYGHVLEALARRGLAAAVLDLRGHGRSAGRRTFVRRFADYRADAAAFLRQQGEARPAGPLLAVGHSMGGLVLARTLQEEADALPELAGAVLSSPFFALGTPVPAWKEVAGRVMSRWLPWFRMPTGIDVAELSTDPEVGRAYEADPLVTSTATSRWFTEALAAHAAVLAAAPRVRLPLLVQHGAADRIADPAATERFHAAAGSPDKELKLWPGLRHELFNERAKAAVLDYVGEWLESRL